MRWASLSLIEMLEDMYMGNTDLIKLMVVGENSAYFTRYFDGNLWYQVDYVVPDMSGSPEDANYEQFEFPVPITDIGTTTFLSQDKAILFMRYIRKHLEMLEKAKEQPQ